MYQHTPEAARACKSPQENPTSIILLTYSNEDANIDTKDIQNTEYYDRQPISYHRICTNYFDYVKSIKLKDKIMISLDALSTRFVCKSDVFLFRLGLISTCISIIPIVAGMSIKRDTSQSSQDLYSDFTSYISIYTNIILCIPLFFDQLFDKLTRWKNTRCNNSSIFFLFLGLLVPDIYIILFHQSIIKVTVFLCLFEIRYQILIFSYLSFLSHYSNKMWSTSTVVFISTMLSIGSMLRLFSFFLHERKSFHILLLTFSYLITFIGILQLIQTIIKWIEHLRKKIKIDENNCYCVVYVTVLLYFLCFSWLLYVYYNQFNMDQPAAFYWNNQYIQAYGWCECVMTLFLLLAEGIMTKKICSKAQNALNTKGMFVRYMSHEIRTPLNTVFLGLEFLKNEIEKLDAKSTSSPLLETVTDIKESCTMSLQVLNELLLFDKLEEGMLKLDVALINAVDFITSCVKPFSIQARQSGITLDVQLCEDYIPELTELLLSADAFKLSQVFRNLVSNGLKFTPSGGTVTVVITGMTVPQDKTGGGEGVAGAGGGKGRSEGFEVLQERLGYVVVVHVMDTGPGISKENQTKLFKEIVQFNPGKLQGGGGSGLGLWISSGLVNLHNGKLSVYSEGEGYGSTFTLELPAYSLPYHASTQLTSASSSQKSKYNRDGQLRASYYDMMSQQTGDRTMLTTPISTGSRTPPTIVSTRHALLGLGGETKHTASPSSSREDFSERNSVASPYHVNRNARLGAYAGLPYSNPLMDSTLEQKSSDKLKRPGSVVSSSSRRLSPPSSSSVRDIIMTGSRHSQSGGAVGASSGSGHIPEGGGGTGRGMHYVTAASEEERGDASSRPSDQFEEDDYCDFSSSNHNNNNNTTNQKHHQRQGSYHSSSDKSIPSTRSNRKSTSANDEEATLSHKLKHSITSLLPDRQRRPRAESDSGIDRIFNKRTVSSSYLVSVDQQRYQTQREEAMAASQSAYKNNHNLGIIASINSKSSESLRSPSSDSKASLLDSSTRWHHHTNMKISPMQRPDSSLRSDRSPPSPRQSVMVFEDVEEDSLPLSSAPAVMSVRRSNSLLSLASPKTQRTTVALIAPAPDPLTNSPPLMQRPKRGGGIEEEEEESTSYGTSNRYVRSHFRTSQLSPRISTSQKLPSRSTSDSATGKASPSLSRLLRLLVVDDAAMNRKMMCRLLGSRCELCLQAVDGSDAVRQFKLALERSLHNREERVFDAILLDYQMPVMNGPEAAKAIRALGYRGIIIGVTGNTSPVDNATFLSYGADHVMLKPLDLEAFDALMRGSSRGRGRGRGSSESEWDI